jgi:MFS-type transporter involved in bile tolerance (Atg22 family)
MISATTALITVVTGSAFAAAPYIGSAYLMVMNGVGNQWPVLTSKLALPLLRVNLGNPCNIPVTGLWVAGVWLLIILSPWCILIRSWHSRTLEDCQAGWVSGMAIYLPVLCGIMVAVISGLAVSLACL